MADGDTATAAGFSHISWPRDRTIVGDQLVMTAFNR
jgi:hypothetical protein